MNTCYKCAFKHVSTATVVWSEITQGYVDDIEHIGALIGELNCASNHLFEKQPDLAESLRQDRVKLLDAFAQNPGTVPKERPDFEGYLTAILTLLRDQPRETKGLVSAS